MCVFGATMQKCLYRQSNKRLLVLHLVKTSNVSLLLLKASSRTLKQKGPFIFLRCPDLKHTVTPVEFSAGQWSTAGGVRQIY